MCIRIVGLQPSLIACNRDGLSRHPDAATSNLYPSIMVRQTTPELIPLLSRGKHRSPRKGGCFMEYASLLAGERWSDHPRCTHPLLATVARAVNDFTSDSGRSRLVGLIPSVIGLQGTDPRVNTVVAIRCASTGLPVVAEHRQRALAAGLLTAQRVHNQLGGRPGESEDPSGLFEDADAALAAAPHAARWAVEFVGGNTPGFRTFSRQSAPSIVRVAVVGVAEAAIADPDTMLYDLLAKVIDDSEDLLGSKAVQEPGSFPKTLVQTELSGPPSD